MCADRFEALAREREVVECEYDYGNLRGHVWTGPNPLSPSEGERETDLTAALCPSEGERESVLSEH